MPTIKVKASELTEASINLVSMVKRGANRVPYRVVKEDSEMGIDLYKLGRGAVVKAEASEPRVVAVVLAKSADTDGVRAVLKAHGVDDKAFARAEKDGMVTMTKADVDLSKESEDGVALIKVSDGVAFLVKADVEIVKSLSLYDWDSTSFSDIMTKGSFIPSLSVASDMLDQTFYNICQKADDPGSMAKLMGSACDDFKSYVTTLSKGLPKTVFKAEADIRKAEEISDNPVVNTRDGRPTGHGGKMDVGQQAPSNDIEGNPIVDGSGGNKAGVSGGKTALVGTAPTNDIEGNSVERAGAGTSVTVTVNKDENGNKVDVTGGGVDDPKRNLNKDGKTSGAGAADAPSVETALLKALEKSGADLLKSVEQKLAPVVSELSGLKDRIQKAEEAVNGTVVGGAQSDKVGITKGEPEEHGSMPLLDTAITPIANVERAEARRTRH